jgi:hypothetical protein
MVRGRWNGFISIMSSLKTGRTYNTIKVGSNAILYEQRGFEEGRDDQKTGPNAKKP